MQNKPRDGKEIKEDIDCIRNKLQSLNCNNLDTEVIEKIEHEVISLDYDEHENGAIAKTQKIEPHEGITVEMTNKLHYLKTSSTPKEAKELVKDLLKLLDQLEQKLISVVASGR